MNHDITLEFNAIRKRISKKQPRVHATPRAASKHAAIVSSTLAHAEKTRQAISCLRTFLVQNARDYIGATRHTRKAPSESMLDAIDSEAKKIKEDCDAKLKQLQQAVPDHGQVNEWGWDVPQQELPAIVAGTVASLTQYHTRTTLFFEGLKKARERRAVRCHRLSKPCPIKASLMRDASSSAATAIAADTAVATATLPDTLPATSTTPTPTHRAKFEDFVDEDVGTNADGTALQDEIRQENAMLFKKMSSIAEVVDQTAQKASEILNLQAKFSALLADQTQTIEAIDRDTIETRENVQGGNKEIKEATKSGNDMRWMIVFILLMCSATLLLLDWKHQSPSAPASLMRSDHQEL